MNVTILEHLAPFLPLMNNKSVLELGSRYVNGSIRPFAELFAKNYIGVDIQTGRYVDIICSAEKLLDKFDESSIDVVICLETLEHIKNWKLAVQNIKSILKEHGYAFISAPAIGFPFHAHPNDFWRFEPDDFQSIFSDFEIVHVSKDNLTSILVARKPLQYQSTACELEVYRISPPSAPHPVIIVYRKMKTIIRRLINR